MCMSVEARSCEIMKLPNFFTWPVICSQVHWTPQVLEREAEKVGVNGLILGLRKKGVEIDDSPLLLRCHL